MTLLIKGSVESNSIALFSSHSFIEVVYSFGTNASFSCIY